MKLPTSLGRGAFAVMALAIAGCASSGGGKTVRPQVPAAGADGAAPAGDLDDPLPYSTLVPLLALERGWLREGDQIVLVVRHGESQQLLAGVRLRVAGPGGSQGLVSDAQGRISLPVSHQLARGNALLHIDVPSGVRKVEFSASFTFRIRCQGHGGPPEATTTTVDPGELAGWPSHGLGPDTIYAEPGTDTSAVAQLVALIARERQILRKLVGREPPPIRLAIVGTQRKVAQDEDGRPVWTVPLAELNDDGTVIGTVVHEWTHDICNQMGLSGDQTTRYLEDGLCDLLAYLVFREIRPGRLPPLVIGRLSELAKAASTLQPRVDLLMLGQQMPDRSGESLEVLMKAVCDNPLTPAGYALGLAYWLDHLDAKRDLVQAFFAAVTPTVGKSGSALVTLVESLAPRRSRATELQVKRALAILRRHQRPRMPPR